MNSNAQSLRVVDEAFVGLQIELGAEHLVTLKTASLASVHGSMSYQRLAKGEGFTTQLAKPQPFIGELWKRDYQVR